MCENSDMLYIHHKSEVTTVETIQRYSVYHHEGQRNAANMGMFDIFAWKMTLFDSDESILNI